MANGLAAGLHIMSRPLPLRQCRRLESAKITKSTSQSIANAYPQRQASLHISRKLTDALDILYIANFTDSKITEVVDDAKGCTLLKRENIRILGVLECQVRSSSEIVNRSADRAFNTTQLLATEKRKNIRIWRVLIPISLKRFFILYKSLHRTTGVSVYGPQIPWLLSTRNLCAIESFTFTIRINNDKTRQAQGVSQYQKLVESLLPVLITYSR